MDQKTYDEMRRRLLEEPYRVIDFLPRQVPQESGGNYFAVERYLTEHPRIDGLYSRFAGIVMKLNCYYGMALYDPRSDAWSDDPAPEELARQVEACAATGPDRYLQIIFPTEDALLTLDGDDLYMTLYHARGQLLETAAQLAAAAGLFLRPGVMEEPLRWHSNPI